jgi:iron(III) transport system ATP-binding protein
MIKLKKVSKIFGNVKAVDDISFAIDLPGITVIMGPSGSGKSTFLRLIAGLEMPDSGEIFIHDRLASRQGWILPPYQRKMGFVFQAAALWPHMTVEQNILFGISDLKKEEKKERLKQLLHETDLGRLAKRYPDQISGGEARRVAICRAIASRPEYLLLDEPMSNLNIELKNKLLKFLKESVASDSKYIIYVTHDIGEAKEVSDNIVVFDNGRIK